MPPFSRARLYAKVFDGVPPEPTRMLLSLLRVYQRDARATINSLIEETGLSRATVHKHLCRLRDLELVAYGTAGALRPRVRVVR